MNRRDFIRLLGAAPVLAAIPATKVTSELTADTAIEMVIPAEKWKYDLGAEKFWASDLIEQRGIRARQNILDYFGVSGV